jgi:hypothetical protein
LNALTAREKEEMRLYYNTVMEKRNSKDTDNMPQAKYYTEAEPILMQDKRDLELKLQIEADKNSAKVKKEEKQVKTKAGSSTVKPIAKSSVTEDIGYMLRLLYVVMSFDKEVRKVKYKHKETQKQSQFDVYTALLANPHHNGVIWTTAGRESEGHSTWVK